MVENLPASAGDSGSIPESGRSPGAGHGNPLQYSCLENSTDREAWWATVLGVPKSRTWLSMHAPRKQQQLLFEASLGWPMWRSHFVVVVVKSLSCIRLFVIPWTAAYQVSLSFTISRILLELMSTESVIPSNRFILYHHFSSCPQPFPASGSFPVSWLFTSGGQSIGASASASILPMNIQGWFPLRLTGLIFSLSKGLSRVFNTTVRKLQFFSTQPSLRPNSHISLYISLNKTNEQKTHKTECCSGLSLNAMGACAGPRFESGELVKSPALNKWGWNESLGRILPQGREIWAWQMTPDSIIRRYVSESSFSASPLICSWHKGTFWSDGEILYNN